MLLWEVTRRCEGGTFVAERQLELREVVYIAYCCIFFVGALPMLLLFPAWQNFCPLFMFGVIDPIVGSDLFFSGYKLVFNFLG